MVTKFEKRVLALLMAGLLCVPVIASSPVTVNAEEAEKLFYKFKKCQCVYREQFLSGRDILKLTVAA